MTFLLLLALVLAPGTPHRASLAAGETATFEIVVPAGSAARITVEQEGIDVVASLAGDEGELDESDAANGVTGEERLVTPIGAARWSVTISAVVPRASPGEFLVEVDVVAENDDLLHLLAVRRRFREARGLHASREGTALREAIAAYDEAAADGGEWLAAEALYQSALAADLLGDNPEAIARFERLLPETSRLGLDGRRARVLDRLGDLARKTGRPGDAESYLAKALPAARAVRDPVTEADVLNNHGLLLSSIGRWEEAIAMLESAVPLAQEVASLDVESALHHNVGYSLAHLGEYERSLEAYERALALKRKMGRARRTARTLNNVASVRFAMGEREKAMATLLEVLELWEVSGDEAGRASSLAMLGRMHHAAGENAAAVEAFSQSLPLLREVGARAAEGNALNAWAEIDLAAGDADAALEKVGRALDLNRETVNRRGEARSHFVHARALRQKGNLGEAIAAIEKAIAIVEHLREGIARRDFQSSYLSTIRAYYDLYIELLLEEDPGTGAAAFEVSERARARSLLESLAESAAKIRKGIDPELRARERAVQAELNAREAYRARLRARGGTAAEIEALTRDVERLIDAWRGIQAEIRKRSPAYAALKMPEPVSVETVQASLVGPGTALVEYHLGVDWGAAWVIDGESATVHELSGRDVVEPLARRYHDLLRRDREGLSAGALEDLQRQLASTAAEIAAAVLAPIASRIEGKRLLIVPDGALLYVPFAALPAPGSSEPMIARHEIVHLPSATALEALRRDPNEANGGGIAIFADAVFETTDPRVDLPDGAGPAAARGGPFPYTRLRFSRREAEAIETSAAGRTMLRAFGFDAAKATLLDSDLGDYDILHFATHGDIDTEKPELSGLVLSLYDERGRNLDGFLRLHEIYNLELDASLVVLSACSTALGKEVHGEGLIGLTRGFMYAGADRVLATTWNVADRATAILMSRFYDELLGERERPAAALRAAQLSLLAEPRWSDPHYWAAFSLQGEWR
ncbi:MAG: CHAT domain-containing protein [Thermoanaerobaculia bacterium]